MRNYLFDLLFGRWRGKFRVRRGVAYTIKTNEPVVYYEIERSKLEVVSGGWMSLVYTSWSAVKQSHTTRADAFKIADDLFAAYLERKRLQRAQERQRRRDSRIVGR